MEALSAVQAEISDAYRDAFIEVASALREQASALNRIQATLQLLVSAVKPELAAQIPPAIRIAAEGEDPDLASALVVADPIATGYTLGQVHLAQALGINQADVSILVRAFKLKDEPDCAVVVRKGAKQTMVNYHRRAIKRFRELVAKPPAGLTKQQSGALERARKRIIVGTD